MRTIALLSVLVLVVVAGCADGGTIRTATTPTEPSTSPQAESPTDSSVSLNSTRIERLVHRYVNAERADRGRSNLSFDPALAEIARYHSRDMARNDYFAHTAPDGETVADRYDRFGYECRVRTGPIRYATGGENIATIRFSGVTYTEREIARQIVAGWMDSPGHRENLLRSDWGREGIGSYADREGGTTRVYVTQNFC